MRRNFIRLLERLYLVMDSIWFVLIVLFLRIFLLNMGFNCVGISWLTELRPAKLHSWLLFVIMLLLLWSINDVSFCLFLRPIYIALLNFFVRRDKVIGFNNYLFSAYLILGQISFNSLIINLLLFKHVWFWDHLFLICDNLLYFNIWNRLFFMFLFDRMLTSMDSICFTL